MKMPNKVYDVLKYVSMIFLPALITFYGVVGTACNIPYTDTVLTIATAFNVFLGSCLGISTANYRKEN